MRRRQGFRRFDSFSSDFLKVLQKASPVWGFPADNWNATQPSFLLFGSFSSEFFTILQKASPRNRHLQLRPT
jgi:hypothetical protein